MTVPLPVADDNRVVVEGETVHIRDLIEDKRDVVRVVQEADNPAEATRALLVMGAVASRAVAPAVDAVTIAQHFDALVETFETEVGRATAEVVGVTEHLFDEDEGAVPVVLDRVKQDLAGLLEGAFDENSRTSALAKIDAVVRDAQAQLVGAVRSDLDPDVETSALARTRKSIAEVVKDQAGAVLNEVRALAVQTARLDGRSEMSERTAVKGFAFEDLVEEVVAQFAASHGDLVERTGRTSGPGGTQRGDVVVTLSGEDTAGRDARFVIEAKDRRLTTPKALSALDQAVENHEAGAGLLVFSRQEHAPTAVPFSHFGSRAVAVLDKDDPDERVLGLAYMWARWVVRRQLASDPSDTIDVARVEELLGSAEQGLAIQQSIKAAHTSAKHKIDQAADHLDRLVRDVDAALHAIAKELEP